MDFKQIQELIKMINKSNISELSIEQDKFKITIKQKENEVQQIVTVPAITAVQACVSGLSSLQLPLLRQLLPRLPLQRLRRRPPTSSLSNLP